jgi:putative addiction module component (TIGR02574 family)
VDLRETVGPTAEELPLAPEVAAELERRLRDLREHPDASIPWEEVRARLHTRFGACAPE